MPAPPPRPKFRRQAVIVIHGVGEQRPMDTLRGFVEAVLGIDPDARAENDRPPPYYSRPDMFADSYELRRLTVANARPPTDFFEFYWAHKMPVATWDRMVCWLRLLLLRRRSAVPEQLRGLWLFCWLISSAVVASLLVSVVMFFAGLWGGGVGGGIPIGVTALMACVEGVVLAYAGDAAVYLSPDPRNIAARNEIRTAGVGLLKRLHESGDYDRIIVVGHSLGSVIGYDVLCHAWQALRERHGSVDRPKNDQLKEAERLAVRIRDAIPAERPALCAGWPAVSRALWAECRANGSPWLVTDFVTLGSPLAHAALLLAADAEDFRRKIRQFEMPSCPPAPDHRGELGQEMQYELPEGGGRRTIRVLQHAALFSVTRWTNFHFPCRWICKGDIIGGPTAPVLGEGIQDRAVTTPVWGGWLAHTHYWARGSREAVEALSDALDLRCRTFRADHEH